jgi:hypothetical protein
VLDSIKTGYSIVAFITAYAKYREKADRYPNKRFTLNRSALQHRGKPWHDLTCRTPMQNQNRSCDIAGLAWSDRGLRIAA